MKNSGHGVVKPAGARKKRGVAFIRNQGGEGRAQKRHLRKR